MLGKTLQNRYRLDETIGQGGMGIVYRAFDTVLQRPVAVKLLSNSQLGTEGPDQMLREAQATARLNHPNIVAIHDVGRTDDTPFIVMELVEGRPLRSVKTVTLAEAVNIAQSICAALSHAHQNNIIHRDLKPENIFLSNSNTIKLMDFGLAQMQEGPNLSGEGLVVGTFNYMAPELLSGGQATPQSDLYALGIVLYELVAGRPPFTGENLVAILSQHLNAPVSPPSNYNQDIPPGLDRLILQLLSKEPEKRPRSAQEVSSFLTALITSFEQPATTLAETQFSLLDRIVRGRLISRRAELQQLTTLWQRTRQGQSHLVLLSGEPGAGKTRLAEEFLVEVKLRGIPVFRGSSYENEAITPYLPLIEALREWVHIQETGELTHYLGDTAAELARLAPEIETKLGPLPPGPVLSPDEARSRLLDNVARFLQKLAGETGLVVFLDDLHWADTGTLNLIHYLLRRLRQERLFILANYREEELDRTHPLSAYLVTWNRERLATRISLGRFSQAETAEMLASLFGQEIVAPDFTAAIFRETEGNPFFIEEVVKALIDQEQIYRQDGEWLIREIEDLTIPQSVKEAIGRRLNRLSNSCIDVLYTAAVLGKQFDFANLAAAYDDDEENIFETLDEAATAQLIRLVSGETFAFTHDKIREVLYEEINPIRRRRIHQRIGLAFEKRHAKEISDHVQELAFHFVRASEPEKGLRYSLAAAEKAYDLSSLDESVTYYEQARQCAIDVNDERQQIEINSQLGRIYTLQGAFAQAKIAYKRAMDMAATSQEKTALNARLIGVGINAGEMDASDTLLETIEQLDPQEQARELAEALTLLGRHYHYKAEFEKAIDSLDRACLLAEEVNDPYILTIIHSYMAGAYQHQFLLQKCLYWARRSIAFGEEHQYLPAIGLGYEFLSETSILLGKWSDGYEYALKNEEFGKQIGSRDRIAWANMAKGWAYLRMGRFHESLRYSQIAKEIAEATNQDRLIALIAYNMMQLYVDIGQINLAESETKQLLTLAAGLNQQWINLQALHAQALLKAVKGDKVSALQILKQVRNGTSKYIIQAGLLFTGHLYGELLFLTGQLDQAESHLREVVEIARTTEASFQEGANLRVLGQVLAAKGRPEAALEAFNKAIASQEEHDTLPELARSLYYRGRFLQKTGQPEAAENDLREAQTLIDDMNLIPDLFNNQ